MSPHSHYINYSPRWKEGNSHTQTMCQMEWNHRVIIQNNSGSGIDCKHAIRCFTETTEKNLPSTKPQNELRKQIKQSDLDINKTSWNYIDTRQCY